MASEAPSYLEVRGSPFILRKHGSWPRMSSFLAGFDLAGNVRAELHGAVRPVRCGVPLADDEVQVVEP